MATTGLHACIWHQGTSLDRERGETAPASDDGIFQLGPTAAHREAAITFVNQGTATSTGFLPPATSQRATRNGLTRPRGAPASASSKHNNVRRYPPARPAPLRSWDSLKSSSDIPGPPTILINRRRVRHLPRRTTTPGDGRAPATPSAVSGLLRTTGNQLRRQPLQHPGPSGLHRAVGVWLKRPWPPL